MTTIQEKSRGIPDSLSGIKVIDADTHLTEPADLWTSKAPSKYKDLVPRVVSTEGRTIDTKTGRRMEGSADQWVWMVNNQIMGQAGGGSVVNRENVKVKGAQFIHWPLTEASPAASMLEPRLNLMDEVGIHAQIIYPNVVGFGGQAFGMIEDMELRTVCARIWNDTMIELYEQSHGRLNGMAMMPWWDVDECVREVERAHRLGLKGVNMTSDPQNHGMPDLADEAWSPVWEVCEGLGMPINFHIGASQTQMSWFGTSTWPSSDDNTRLALGSAMMYLSNARVVGNIIYSGVLDRYPRLKFVSVESGIGWIPFFLAALDYQTNESDVRGLSMLPSEYFRRNFWSCFWFEGNAGSLIADVDALGWDKVMYETDFPHPTCLYPDPLTAIGETLEVVDFAKRKLILSTNASKVYNIDLP